MTRCYLDTNFLYAQRRPGSDQAGADRERSWRSRVEELAGGDDLCVSALTLDEVAYRLCLAWLSDDGEADPLSRFRADSAAAMRQVGDRLGRTWSALDALGLRLVDTDATVVDQARRLMSDPGLAPRDAFHAAHALAARCEVLVSSDDAFDAVPNLRRLGIEL